MWKDLSMYVVCAVLGAFGAYQVTSDHWQQKWTARDNSDLTAQVIRANELRELRAGYDKQIADNDARYQAELGKVENDKDDLLKSVRAGSLKLRKKFECPTASAVSNSAAGISGTNTGSNAQLSGEDVEFLISESARANREVVKLNKCIRQLATDRGLINNTK